MSGRMYPKTLKSYITNPRICNTAVGSSRHGDFMLSQHTMDLGSPSPMLKKKTVFQLSIDGKDMKNSQASIPDSSTKAPMDTTINDTAFESTQNNNFPIIRTIINMDPSKNEFPDERPLVPQEDSILPPPRQLKTANLNMRVKPRLGQRQGSLISQLHERRER